MNPIITAAELQRRLIRRTDHVSCAEAFIDCRMPGSVPKDNFSFIGPGVTQSAEQFVNLREPHGFNFGAAGLPPGVTNNQHLHFTSETFIAAGSRFTLRWGAAGDEGEMEMNPGDIACMPPWMFRGFTNTGDAYGLMLTVLGGDDTGGIIWSPEVMRRARATGLYLGRDNQLIDTARPDGSLADAPAESGLLPLMPAHEVAALRRRTVAEMRGRALLLAERDFRPATLDALLPGHGWQLAPAVGFGLSQHRDHAPRVMEPQGFSVEWLRVGPGQSTAPFFTDEAMVLLQMGPSLEVQINRGAAMLTTTLGEHDALSVPAGAWRSLVNRSDAPAEAIVVLAGSLRKQPHFGAATVQEALRADVALDASGCLARASLLPAKAPAKASASAAG